MKMWKDPIVEEVRAAREAYAKRFGYDLRKIGRDLQKQEQQAAKAAASPARKKVANRKRPAA